MPHPTAFGQMTDAGRLAMFAFGGSSSRPKRRRKRKATAGKKKRASVGASLRSAKRPARLVKGSAAAKRYMAALRKRRRK